MANTVTAGMHPSAYDSAAQSVNELASTFPLDQGKTWVKPDPTADKSFTVFEEVDHSKKSMIQFLTKVGSIQNLQQRGLGATADPQQQRQQQQQRLLSASAM